MALPTNSHLLQSFGLAGSTLIAIWIVHTTARIIYNIFLHPLRSFPGPKSWAATALPAVFAQVRGTEVYDVLKLHELYGPVVRTAPNELSYANSIVYKDVFSHRQGHAEFGKSSRTVVTPPNGVHGILTANRADHSRFRRAFSASFSDRGMQRQQPLITRYVDLFIQGLKSKSAEGPQDLVAWFNWTTFDIIGALTFGEDFGCLKLAKMHPWISATFGSVKGNALMAAVRRLGLGAIIPYIVPKKSVDLRLANSRFSADRIKSRMELGTDLGDFMDPVLEKHVGEKEGSLHLTFDELASIGSNLVMAGSETTATLLSGAVFHLLKNPVALEKTVEEIRRSFDSADEIDLMSTTKLHYMLAVLNETMRIFNPVPAQSTRESPPGGDTIDGKFVPEKTVIYAAQYVTTHLSENFTKPNGFYPERFLQSDGQSDSEFKNDNFAVFQPFSVGPRNCIGKNLAYAEMRIILARLLFDFDLELDERSRSWTRGMKAFVLWEKPSLWVKLTARGV
ncbi:hypothetical protein EG328_010294 [Venturia inaequalis]|uniref:Cytochrome P450 n=1 Tax=Venturia inaequalis TaxID=5025 RepID=A0A8H3U7P7_VENIN|nr:hypothetical protein EG328_010294 [Venturia inaequalis]KAE9989809.1 hypothetical protein EG327_002197 [Venturia inaequalis]RDI85744.1 hypothetical protein Vi05172_g4533 [Venturia inaequalis]